MPSGVRIIPHRKRSWSELGNGEFERLRLRFPEFIESLGPEAQLQFIVMGPEFRTRMQRRRDIRRVLRAHILGEATGLDPCSDRDLRLANEGQSFAKFVKRREHRFFQKRGLALDAFLVFVEFDKDEERGEKRPVFRRCQACPQIATSACKRTERDVGIHNDAHGKNSD
jgi:hypothetical protein